MGTTEHSKLGFGQVLAPGMEWRCPFLSCRCPSPRHRCFSPGKALSFTPDLLIKSFGRLAPKVILGLHPKLYSCEAR